MICTMFTPETKDFKITFNWEGGGSVETITVEQAKRDLRNVADRLEHLEVGETYTVERVA